MCKLETFSSLANKCPLRDILHDSHSPAHFLCFEELKTHSRDKKLQNYQKTFKKILSDRCHVQKSLKGILKCILFHMLWGILWDNQKDIYNYNADKKSNLTKYQQRPSCAAVWTQQGSTLLPAFSVGRTYNTDLVTPWKNMTIFTDV